jgi:hypothetical protein
MEKTSSGFSDQRLPGFLLRMPESLEQLDLLLIQVAKARQVPG